MHAFLRTTLAATAAVLVLPVTASAADIGSSLDPARGVADTIECPSGCTFALDTAFGQVYADDDGTISSFRAKLAAGSTATLRTFSRGGYGAMTPVGTGPTVTGTGNLETYTTSMRIGRNETIGLDLQGTIDATRDTGTIRVLGGYPAPAGVESETDGYDLEPTLNAQFTPDYAVAPPADSGASTGGGSAGADAGSPTTTTNTGTATDTGADATKGSPRSNENIRSRTTFTIQDTGLLVRGRKPVVTAYVYNGHNDAMTGKATLTVGGKVVSRVRVYVSTIDEAEFKVSKKVAKAIAKGKPATVAATVSNDEDGTESDTFAPTFAKTKTKAFDGRYKAKGPVTFEVRNGVVTGLNTNLLAMSTQGSGSMMRSFYLPDGVPAIVGKDGKVEVHGHWSSDEVRFKGEFAKNGSVKGYTSLWHYQLGLSSGGRFESKPFLGASNWVAERVGR